MEAYKVDFELIAKLANNSDWDNLGNYLDNCTDAYSAVKMAKESGAINDEQIKEYAMWKLATSLFSDTF